ncbi:GntR family transcriptional regulator [Paenibacillus sp. N1-5-1-14]|uniref:GntR family transcriptional regulator n=1 Tax=Paenibacillus radicibacter TaxID=2972488 RepID=UPI002159034A|nr:GntR family transcriptional regulator [Paenibacillus radicibacter]MCR8643186.1 GntR family transcriptional regulator [Paenibacillus radicibacter]
MRIPIQISNDSAEPLYYQIEVQLKALILSGQLAEGALLPSIRELAQQLACSVITIRRVYQDLENEGILRTRQGTGTFVANVGQTARDNYRTDAVLTAMKEAILTGIRVKCTDAELEELFRAALQEVRDQEKA